MGVRILRDRLRMTTFNGVSCWKQICQTRTQWILQRELKQQMLMRRLLEHRNQPLKGWTEVRRSQRTSASAITVDALATPRPTASSRRQYVKLAKRKVTSPQHAALRNSSIKRVHLADVKRRHITSRTSSNREKTTAAVTNAFCLKSGIACRTQSKSTC